jgi:hypothetical protein
MGPGFDSMSPALIRIRRSQSAGILVSIREKTIDVK